MAQLRIRGLVAGYNEHEKKWNGEVQKDQAGNVKMNRKVSVLDMDSEHADIFKINVPVEMVELVKAAIRQQVEILAEVGLMNNTPFFRLAKIQDAK